MTAQNLRGEHTTQLINEPNQPLQLERKEVISTVNKSQPGSYNSSEWEGRKPQNAPKNRLGKTR